nr:putative nucleotidyltransferase, ribonuclease H [Tanacetum cinerariifolium]
DIKKCGIFRFIDYELPSEYYKDIFYEVYVEKEKLKAELKWNKKDRCNKDEGGKLKGKIGPEMIEVTNTKVAVAKEKLKEARTRQKSYADKHRRSLEFQPGDHVFLKVSPARGVRRFGIKGKLSPRFIGPFEILDLVGEVSYRLALPPQLVMRKKTFPFVKILWRNQPEQEATWEIEESIRTSYPHFLP